MKPNLIRQKLDQGRAAFGHMLMEFGTRGIAKIVESAELDFVLLDMEHSSMDLEKIADLLAWLKATPVTPVVRVPASSYHFIARVLDAGALGVMVPSVESEEQAQSIVAAVKYAPQGRRGVGLGVAHTDYLPVAPADYLREANASTTVICQIETSRGLENVEAIAAVSGVDILWVGHFDLTCSMGIPGSFGDPRFGGALRRVAEVARRNGKHAGIQPGTLEQATEWMSIGYRIISYHTDIAIYSAALRTALAQLKSLEVPAD